MLRNACGYKLANDGIDTRALQAYLGHRNIQNTTRYTALAPDRFKDFWKDKASGYCFEAGAEFALSVRRVAGLGANSGCSISAM
jgi:hypothetical protein